MKGGFIMKWFTNPKTLEELKKQYKQFAVQYHPDRGGKLKDMQEINAEYDELFKKLKNIHATTDGKYYNQETNESKNEFKNIIDKLINLNISIEICGSWVWVTGNTYSYRDTLKSLKFRFSNSKKAWYYHADGYRKSSRKSYTLDEIRDLYGSETITQKPQLKLSII